MNRIRSVPVDRDDTAPTLGSTMPSSLLSDRYRRRKPPSLRDVMPNSTRWRLFGMLLALFLVFKLFDVVRDPRSWQWFLVLSGQQTEPAEKIPDGKLPRSVDLSRLDHPDTVLAPIERPIITRRTSTEAEEPVDAVAPPVERAWREGWRDIFNHLQFAERGLIYRMLKAARDDQPLDEDRRAALQEVTTKLDKAWSTYQAEAALSLVTIPEEERAAWLMVLQQAGARWREEMLPAFDAAVAGKPWAMAYPERLAALQELLDANQLKEVQDDTLWWRPQETEIGFRLFEHAQAITPGSSAAKAATPVSYLQLFKQSNNYRGQTVRIAGRARQAWHVSSAENWVGIKGYYVFVIRPPDVNSTVIVYTLELPPGFPPVKDKEAGHGVTDLSEDMEFTGVYFKRMAYNAQGGAYTAPLILAKAGKWTPQPLPITAPMTLEQITFARQVIGGTILALGVTFLMGWYFWPRAPRAPLPAGEALADNWQQLNSAPLTSVVDELKHLERREAQE